MVPRGHPWMMAVPQPLEEPPRVTRGERSISPEGRLDFTHTTEVPARAARGVCGPQGMRRAWCWRRQMVWALLALSCGLSLPLVSTMPGAVPLEKHPDSSPNTNSTCIHGFLDEDLRCICDPCWDGPSCSSYVDYYSPRFLVHAATAVLPVNATGVVYRAWSTDEDLGLTCPLGPGDSARCPCASVTYQLFAPPGDHHFLLDPVSGILTRNTNTSLHPGTTYTYKLMVQGTPLPGQMEDLLYDLLDLRVYVSADYVKKIPWT
nr:uncharacterized protein LOC123773111 [Procambarus clarkii]